MSESIIRKSTIMFTDMVGYSRISSKDESNALKLLEEHNNILLLLINEHGGNVIKFIGDSIFAEFKNSTEAVNSALAIQKKIKKRNKQSKKNDRFEVRIGLHMGKFVVKDDDLFGNDVNLGSRIEGIAPPSGIAISNVVFETIQDDKQFFTREMGHVKLKNIKTPQALYLVYLDKTEYDSQTKEELREFQITRGVNFVDPEQYKEQETQSIAILNLENLGKIDDEFFCYSITEKLISDMKKVPQLRLPAINEINIYKNTELPQSEVARRLHVDNILSGKILKSKDQFKAILEMINTDTGNVIWNETWGGNIKQLRGFLNKMIIGVLEKLDIDIPEHNAAYFSYKMTDNSTALQNYMKAKHIIDNINTPDDSKKAEKLLNEAIDLDGDFVEARAILATTYRWMYRFEDAEDTLENALEIAETNHNDHGMAEVLNKFGIIYRAWGKNDKAIKYFEKALELEVQLQERFSEATILHNIGGCYSALYVDGATNISQEYLLRALTTYQELEEETFIGRTQAELGNNYKNKGELSKALEYHIKALGKFRAFTMTLYEFRLLVVLSDTYATLGMYREASNYIESALPMAEEYNEYYSLGRLYSTSSEVNIWNGKQNQAINDLKQAAEYFQLAERGYQAANHLNSLVILYLESGNVNKAHDIFNKANRLLSKNKKIHHDVRGKIIGELIKVINGEGDLEKLNSIDTSDYECNWLLSQCYRLMGQVDQANQYREIARETLMEESNHISNPDQWKNFLEKNVLHRRIISNEQIFTIA